LKLKYLVKGLKAGLYSLSFLIIVYMFSKLAKASAGVAAAGKLGTTSPGLMQTTPPPKAESPVTNYFSTIDATLKREAPELRDSLYPSRNEDRYGWKAWGQKKAMESGYVSDQSVLSKLEGPKKEIASQGITLMRQLSNTSPGLGTKVAKAATESAVRAVRVSKKIDTAVRETPEGTNLKSDFSLESGGRKGTKKNKKRRKHRKTRGK
jgi:hypothetical protein